MLKIKIKMVDIEKTTKGFIISLIFNLLFRPNLEIIVNK